jgi:hypothetical protein
MTATRVIAGLAFATGLLLGCASPVHPSDTAGTMPKDMMCTMECRGGTVDCGFNHCGCASPPSGQKLCALLPGPKAQ